MKEKTSILKKCLIFIFAVGMILTSSAPVFAEKFTVDPNDDPLYFNPFFSGQEFAKSEEFRKKYFDKFDNEVIVAVIDTGFNYDNSIKRYFDGRLSLK